MIRSRAPQLLAERVRKVCLTLGALLTLSCATPLPPRVELSRERATLELPADLTPLLIENLHGDINVRGSADPRLGLYAVVQAIGERPLRAHWKLSQTESGIRVVIENPGGEADPEHRRGRLDLTVFAPSQRPIKLLTSSGAINARGLDASVHARSGSGRIALTSTAEVDVESLSGPIAVSLRAIKFSAPVRIRAGSGNVVVGVPMDASLKLVARAGTRLTQTLGVQATHASMKSATFELNGGAAEVLIESAQGAVALLPITRPKT